MNAQNRSQVNIHVHTIHNGEDSLRLIKEKGVFISGSGNVKTVDSADSVIIGGEKISSHTQIVGMCMTCSKYVTYFSKRTCFCGKIICTSCSKWWEIEQRPVCQTCYKILKSKKFWKTLIWILLSPFVERKEE